jgi:hypothetical protein
MPASGSPDTPGRRGPILQTGRLERATNQPGGGDRGRHQQLAKPDLKVSIYVFGDEFTGNSRETVLKAVGYMNSRDFRRGARIHIS